MHNSRLENEIIQRVDRLIQGALSVSLKDGPGRAEELASAVSQIQEMGDLLLEVLEGKEQHLQALLEQLISQRLPDRRILQSFGNFSSDINYIITEGIAGYLKSKSSYDDVSGYDKEQAFAAETVADDLYDDSERIETVATEPEQPDTAAATPISLPLKQEQNADPVVVGEEIETADTLPEGSAALSGLQELPAQEEHVAAPEEVKMPGKAVPEAGTPDSTIATASDSDGSNLENLRLALLQVYPGEKVIADYPTPHGSIAFFLPRYQLGFELAETYHDWRYNFFCRRQGISLRLISAEELANPIFLARRLRREALWQQRL